jgi:hypothetical protein
MTPERWSRMKEVFGAALEKPEAERPAFLEPDRVRGTSYCPPPSVERAVWSRSR